MAAKIKISLTVTGDTLKRLDLLSKKLVPHMLISRGDVVDILAAEKIEAVPSGTLMNVFEEEIDEKGA
jgi:hypothetical protein